ncbi:MAG: histidine kinase dimerization/phospho-acceptor domain-containing protein [Chloroflexota bacterium]
MADIQPASPVPLSPESGLLHAQLRTLHAVAEAETYQQIVDSVFHGLSLLEIANCSLWLFGPSEHERAHGPFGYAERVGLRTRVFRPGTEVIRRLPIRFHTPFYERLQSGEPLTAMTAADLDTSNNPIMRTLLKSMPLTDWVICPLNTSTREFGLVFVGVDSDHSLTDEALESLYSVCAQVAVKTALLVLQNEQSSSHHERTALLHTVRDGVLLTQTGSEGASVLAVNERFQRLFNCAVLKPGMQLDVLLNRMQVPPSVRHTLMASWREMSVKEREIQNGSFEMTTVSGQPVEIVWYSAPMINPDSDRVFSRLFIFHDATPERAAVQVRSAFLSRVSHELRTPLTSISGFTQFILQETDDDLPELAREYLIIINESAGKLKEIFKELI